MDLTEDSQLIQRIIKQDQSALTLLYERYGKAVYSLAYRILQNKTMAEEATQDTFMKVWRMSDRWDPGRGQLSSWLLTITRNTAIDRLRAEKRQTPPESTPLESIAEPGSDFNDPSNRHFLNGRILRDLLTQIPDEQRALIELGFFQGYTHQEMAGLLDLPLGTVKTRVRLGLQKLRTLWYEANTNPETT